MASQSFAAVERDSGSEEVVSRRAQVVIGLQR